MNLARKFFPGQSYAFVVVGVIFLSLLAAAGLRATPGVLILPLEKAFGWERETISLAAAIGIFLYGLMGPFAAALMQSFGIKRVLLCALVLMSFSTWLSGRSEEHTSELQSLMRISYAVFSLKKQTNNRL